MKEIDDLVRDTDSWNVNDNLSEIWDSGNLCLWMMISRGFEVDDDEKRRRLLWYDIRTVNDLHLGVREYERNNLKIVIAADPKTLIKYINMHSIRLDLERLSLLVHNANVLCEFADDCSKVLSEYLRGKGVNHT